MYLKILSQYTLTLMIFVSVHTETIHQHKFIPPDQLSPTNIDTSKIISVESPTPLIARLEKYSFETVKNTGKAIAFYPFPFTRTHFTGGLLGNKTYRFYRNFLRLNQNSRGRSGNTIDGKGYPIEGVVIIYNEAYGTYENAMNFDDGLIVLSELVEIGSKNNSAFIPFEKILLSGTLKEPNSSAVIASKNVFNWYSSIPISHAYYVYQGSYYDPEIDKQISKAICVLTQPPLNYISKAQFEAFKNVLGFDGKSIETITPIYPARSREIRATKGVLVEFIPFGRIVYLLQLGFLYLSKIFV